MAVVPLSIKRDALQAIVDRTEKEHIRDLSDNTADLFLNVPQDESLTEEQREALTTLRDDVEAIGFTVGRNSADGFAVVQVNKLEIGEYVDSNEKPTGEFYFLIHLGQIIKHNLT